MPKLIETLSKIIDVRDSRGKRHSLLHVMVIAICAMLQGYNDFEDIYDYAKAKEDWLNEKLKLWNGIPCARTMNNIFRLIPAEVFITAFMEWINGIIERTTGEQIIIDGKGIRAAAEKAVNGNIPYIVSAYIADLGISIGQKRVSDKSNEITAIPELIELLEIEGCIITIDAIGTQTKIMDLIKRKKADFVLPLKENQRGVYAETAAYFDSVLYETDITKILSNPIYKYSMEYQTSTGEWLEVYVQRERAHGRKTERIYIKSRNVIWLKDERFKHVVNVVKVITHTTVHDNSIKYYVSSIDLPAIELGKIIRKHWQIENNLHWVLDLYFYEDLSRTNKDNALENLALLRKLVYNIVKLDNRHNRLNKNGNLVKLSTKRKINRYNLYPDEFEELLFSFLPSLPLK
jgi:predicted transposase YbfD/YdcC